MGMDAETETSRTQRGTKRVCKSCEKRFYDLGRDPTICPMCQSSLPMAAFVRLPEPTRVPYSGSWSKSAVARKVIPEDIAVAAIPDDEAASDEVSVEVDAPAADADAVLEAEDETEGDVSDLVLPDDEVSRDE